jgi:DnaJ-class molecular chaperone
MDEIEKYYQILGVESSDSFRTIKKKYTHLALKYHPRSTAYYFNNDKFIDIVLAFDLISKITKYNQDYGFKTKRKIYDEWVQKRKTICRRKC